MLKNNNESTCKRIAGRSMKYNCVRNTFAVAAVILTTLMLTSVFTIMLSLGKNMNIMQLRLQGTCSSIFLSNPSEEQISKTKEVPDIKAVGTYINIGNAIVDGKDDNPIWLGTYDKTEFEQNLTPAICNINGKYPDEENGVMLSEKALEVLEISNPQTGMEIKLPVALPDGTVSEKSFVLSGWYKDFSSISGNASALVAEKYAAANGFTVEKDGVMSVSCKTGKLNNVFEALSNALAVSDEQEFRTTFDVQSENGSVMFMITAAIVLISLIIILSGYLLIYNVMYISVTKDIRFYGMLKTIGTSPVQIRRIVKAQAFRFLIIGLPVGILLGTLISFGLSPLASSMFSSNRESGVMPTDITFNPAIYIGTIIFSILTVALSCRKPAKIASSVSPVEAMKYNGIKGGGKSKERKTLHGGKPFKMAFRNVFREKKRAILVFASLFMGTMAFLAVNTFLGCMKIDNFISTYLPNDYAIYSHNPDESENTEKMNEAMENLAESMKQINGMDFVELNRSFTADLEFDSEAYKPFIDYFFKRAGVESNDEILNEYKNGKYPFQTKVIGVSSRMLKSYNKTAHSKIDIKAFENGEVALAGEVMMDGDGDGILGKTIKITNTQNGKSADLKIDSVSSYENNRGLNIGMQNLGMAPSYILVSDKVIDMLADNPDANNIVADYGKSSEIDVADSKVLSLIINNRYVQSYDIKNKETSEFQTSISSLKVLTSGISIVLILIGILNFINVMLTGVYTRRKELAVLESVGMTKKRIRTMLMFEGVYYAVITICLILTLGNAVLYLVATIARNIADYAVFYYPFALIGAIAAFILAVCTIVPALVYRAASRESVTERLRDAE